MCKADGESTNHLFLHCSMAKQFWDTILTMFVVHWVMPRNVRDLIACWPGALGRHSHALIWRVPPLPYELFMVGTQFPDF